MEYTEEILRKIKNFGYLQYSIDRIISILNPESPAQFTIDLKDDSHPACVMYQAGLNGSFWLTSVNKARLLSIQYIFFIYGPGEVSNTRDFNGPSKVPLMA